MLILGVRLNLDKPIRIALTKLYGIGNKTACQICNYLGFSHKLKIKDLSDDEHELLIAYIKNNYIIEDNLKKIIRENLNHYLKNSSLKGFRHKNGLPVRGQRTCSNGRTKKKFKFIIT